VFAQEIVDLVKGAHDIPGALSTTGTIRSFVRQTELDKTLKLS